MYSHIPFQLQLAIGLLPFCLVGCADTQQDQVVAPETSEQATESKETKQESPAAAETTPDPNIAKQSDTPNTEKMDLATQLRKEQEEFEKQSIEIPDEWKRLGKNHIWADKKNRRVIVRGAICMQEGLLEMFACPRNTKEHEAIVSVHAKAHEVHATLLALGVTPGKPMIWMEEYTPVSGPIMNIEVWWTGEDGQLVKRRAQDMIRNTDTGKAMECEFVFGGSERIFDPHDKKDDYMADYGPMINVANQPDAMIDVSIQSSDEAQGSLFEAFTENVPPVNTKVYIVISDSGKKVERAAPKGE